MGNRRKRDLVYKEIMNHGLMKEDFMRVFCPIGTHIGAETPEELAVSIVGELIRIRAEKDKPKNQVAATSVTPGYPLNVV